MCCIEEQETLLAGSTELPSYHNISHVEGSLLDSFDPEILIYNIRMSWEALSFPKV